MLWRDGSGSVFVLDEWNFGDVFRDEEQFKKWILLVSTQLIFLSLNVAIFTKIIYDNQGMRNVINIKGAGLMWQKLQSPFFSEIGSHFFQNIGGRGLGTPGPTVAHPLQLFGWQRYICKDTVK